MVYVFGTENDNENEETYHDASLPDSDYEELPQIPKQKQTLHRHRVVGLSVASAFVIISFCYVMRQYAVPREEPPTASGHTPWAAII